jgi:hypothetical protein
MPSREASGRVTLALVALVVSMSRLATAMESDPACGMSALVVGAGVSVLRFPHTFLRARSDSVWSRSGPWRRGEDYTLDRVRGEFRLLRPTVPGDTLWVQACWLLAPPPLELRLQRYRPGQPLLPDSLTANVTPPPPPNGRPVTERSTTTAPPGASLNINGNKTVAVDFGSSQDAFLRQSLDLAVSGTLAPGVQLTGVLSDRNTPLSAAGSTQDLQSLDRVLIELTAPHGSAALGDVPLSFTQGEFARLERRVQGMRAEWNVGGFKGTAAAANAQGEYHRLQFFGVDGQQGPYILTDANGGVGISVVAGSEVVTVDGARMARGEGADYAIDYERGRLTFTNRRPITSATRITVDYQFTLQRFRRNLAAAGGRWQRGALYGFTQAFIEADDRGRPLDQTFDASDLQVLAFAGDSTSRAVGGAVTAGGGDYDTVRVDSARVVFAYAGPDSGEFSVQFSRPGANLGDYADSAIVSGRTIYRFVGAGQGAFSVGRTLPLPESHQLWSLGAGARSGPLAVELEGAVSRRDLNTFSALDDQDNVGGAGRARASLEGRLPGRLGGAAGLVLDARTVSARFSSFTRLERPFAEEDWGLPLNADLEHAQRVELSAHLDPRLGGQLHAAVGRLTTPDGFASLRRGIDWTRDGLLATRGSWQRAEGTQTRLRFADGGRDHWLGEMHLRLPWFEPGVRGEADERRSPSDSGRVGDRFRETGLEVLSPRKVAWKVVAGWALRRDARLLAGGFVDQSEARTLRFGLDTPAARRLGATISLQRRDVAPLADPRRSRSDLASVRLRGEDEGRRLKALMNLEITSEGENQRVRQLVFVGGGRGAYDALGNLVGTGDYDLVVVVAKTLDRIARAATSARLEWGFGTGDVWRGSRAEFDFESEARRRGDLLASDPVLSPGAALGDARLARASVVQRFESDLAPDSRVFALRLRAERRASADRSFENFAQTLDDQTFTTRWRARPGAAVSTEIEGRLRRQVADQSLSGGSGFSRTLGERAGTASLIYTPDARLRVVGFLEASWTKPEGQDLATRTIRLGPDAGVSIGSRGRLEASVRRAFLSGAAPVGLLPSADPAGAPRWEGTTRFDYRVRESTTAGISFNVRERPERPALYTGRAELRAFF